MKNVIKRDGSKAELNLDKLHKVVFWATEGLNGVSASEVEIRSHLQFYNNIRTVDIQETLIKAAADLISEDAPNYQYVAGRLVNYQLRKEVYERFQPTRLYDLIRKNIDLGFYDQELLTYYSEDEWDEINGFINHERDMALTYVAMEQMRGKYLVQNRVTGQILETPQVLYILVAAVLFACEAAETRLRWVRDYYEAISRHEISLPTPIMAGVRTPIRQYSSCVLIECDDSLASINATNNAVVNYVSQRAGIGLGAGRIRAVDSPIRNGDTSHTGVTPFFKLFQAGVNSCNQGGLRKGSSTLYVAIWHLEIETILVLKNNKGIEDNRVRHIDYNIQFNRLFYERLIDGGEITLFSPHDVPEMYEAFFSDYNRFKELYEIAERNTRLRKKRIKAIDLFSAFVNERKDTGRIYLMNVDNANTHSPFLEDLAPVRMSNLCTEITQTTTPMNTTQLTQLELPVAEFAAFMLDASNNDKTVRVLKLHNDVATVEVREDMSRIALCTLSAINWGVVKEPASFERICRLTIRALDNLLSYQNYPVFAARKHTEEYRPLGVGIINFAYFLAKNGAKYTDGSGLALVDEWAEAWSYYLIKASAELAKERGPCKLVSNTKYARGILPIDTRKPEVDELVPHRERLDWAGLREFLRTYGIRNSTVMAIMPAECQHWSNKISLGDGRRLDFHELLEDNGIDWMAIEESGIPQRYAFSKPVMINTRYGEKPVYEFYYNGVQDIIEVEFDTGSYYFTPNHSLLVVRNGIEQWIEVQYLEEEDDIVKAVRHLGRDHTWDVSVEGDEYLLPNGVISHNTSAQVSNSTNGIEPPRSYVSVKQSKHGVLKQVVPESRRLKNRYELLWDQPSPEGYLQLCAVLQKYIDQSISVNTSYNPKFYTDEKIPLSELLRHIMLAYRWGIKTLYYNNTNDGQGELNVASLIGVQSEAKAGKLSVVVDDCDSCTI